MSVPAREVVAVFDTAPAMEAAVFDLETHGFDRAAFSVLASEHTVEKQLGRPYRRIEEMEDAVGVPRETFFSRASQIEAEFGPAPALAFMAALTVGLGTIPMLVAAGTGAAVGAVLGRIIHHHHAERLREQIERGGLLLWVTVRDTEQEQKAIDVLQAHAARHVHAHDLADRA